MGIIVLSEIKKVKAFCEGLFSEPDWKEVIAALDSEEDDFTVDGVRFIAERAIDQILADELEGDEYILGCFTSWAIAEATGWPIALIEAAQKGEAYEEIGKAMDKEHIYELGQILKQHDGYGHHFNSYDFSEEELDVIIGTVGEKVLYHVFDCRD